MAHLSLSVVGVFLSLSVFVFVSMIVLVKVKLKSKVVRLSFSPFRSFNCGGLQFTPVLPLNCRLRVEIFMESHITAQVVKRSLVVGSNCIREAE